MYWLIVCLTYLIASLITWLYGKYRMFNTFKRKGIRGPKPHFILGNRLELRNSGKLPHQVISDWIDEYGDVFGYYSPCRARLVINDVQMLKKIFTDKVFQDRDRFVLDVVPMRDSLICTEGERWRRSRKTISPVFANNKVNQPPISTVIKDCVQRFMDKINPTDSSQPFILDIDERVRCFTFDVICRTSLAMEADLYAENDRLMNAVKEYFDFAANPAVVLGEICPFFATILAFINNYLTAGKMTDLIVGHLKGKIKEFINMRSSTSISKTQAPLLNAMLSPLADGLLTEEEFIANIHLIVLAGYEATANSLTFCLYLIAKHQDIQDRLRESLQEGSSEPNYIEMVWLESLRYFPTVVYFVARRASRDTVIEGLHIDSGVVVEAPVWQIHHSERYWPDPWTFDPQRFTPENKKNIEPVSFLPFGLGGRSCIGMNMANTEAREMVGRLVSKYRISFTDKTMDPLRFKCPTVILCPEGPLYLKFQPL